MSARVPMSAKDTMRLIERSPKHPEDTALYPKSQRQKAWFDALVECDVIRKDGISYLVKSQMFFDHKDRAWDKVQRVYLRRLSALVLMAPFQINSSTSKAAAMSMLEEAPSLRQKVYRLLCTEDHTDYETSMMLNRPENSVRPRRVELVGLGLVEAVGERKGPSGRLATLWRGIDA